MTFVKLLLIVIGIFNLMISFWIGCAFFLNILRSRNRRHTRTTDDIAVPSKVEDPLG